jgi:type VI secretion system protein ImpC
MQVPLIPYTILILAPFTGETETIWHEAPLPFDRQEPDALFTALKPSVYIPLPIELCPAGGLTLTFSRRKDFTPDGLMACQPYLANLLEAGTYLEEAERKNLSPQEVRQGLTRWPDLPPIRQRQTTKEKVRRAQSDALESILSMVSMPDTGGSGSPDGYDEIAGQILSQIFHDPSFMKMEAACQGLQLLARECMPDNDVKLLIAPVCHGTFENTLDALLPSLIRNPPSLVLVDLPFDGSRHSVEQLAKLADFGQLLLVPTIAWITADFFQVDSWNTFDRLSFLPHHMEHPNFVKWQKVRQSQAGRWLGLFCNRFLSRYPYGPDNRPRHVDFIETERPWLGPVWAVGKLIGQRVSRSKWPTGISAGRTNELEDLALDLSNSMHPMPVEKLFSDTRLEQLERCGIAALVSRQGSDSVFLSSNTMASSDTNLDYQSLICLVTRFTLWCKDMFAEDLRGEALADSLKMAWKRYQDHRQVRYEDMALNVEISDSGQQTVVCLKWLPSGKVLPSGQELVLEFPW